MAECCPLCGSSACGAFHRDMRRSYLRCSRCGLVFVPRDQRLSRAAERSFYDLHENKLEDPGYRRFLSRLAAPLMQRLPPHSCGLDFGCGPAPALAAMLVEGGHTVALHDSFYAPRPDTLRTRFDFIVATEVVEHLHRPGAVLAQLWNSLRPGGWLGVMTKLVKDREAFSTWHYIRDPTHISFFSRETWHFLARRLAAHPEFIGADVILVQKPVRTPGKAGERATQ